MTSSLLPDINVWVALNFSRHEHHAAANRWYMRLPESDLLVFCRQTQLGLFRILSLAAVMQQDALTQRACWAIFNRWAGTGQVRWADEPRGLTDALRTATSADEVSPKMWMDAYLAAFAEAAGLRLVTLDKALAAKAKGSVLLGQ